MKIDIDPWDWNDKIQLATKKSLKKIVKSPYNWNYKMSSEWLPVIVWMFLNYILCTIDEKYDYLW